MHVTGQQPRVPAGVTAGGQYATAARGEAEVSLLAPAPDECDLTLAGTSRVYDMQRTYGLREDLAKPPVILATDTTAEAVKKWAKYVATNGGLDPEAYAAERGWTPLDPQAEAEARRMMGSRASAGATAWASSGDPDACAVTFLETRPSAKEGSWRSRRDRSQSWAVVNLTTRCGADAITEDMRAYVAEHGGDPDDIMSGIVKRWLTMSGPEAKKYGGMRASLCGRGALGDTPIYGVAPPRPMHSYGADVQAYQDDSLAYRAALLRLAGDEDELRRAFGATDPSKDAEKCLYDPNSIPHEFSFDEVRASARAMHREAVTHLTAVRLVTERFGMVDDLYLTQQRRRDSHSHSATVWEDKKNIPASHVAAARDSTFRRHGMGHVEVDESVDLDDFRKVEGEWAALSKVVPHTKAPSRMAFRLTGRHNAAGVYAPDIDAIAVDPRHPSSMWHEYVHHLDHTSGPRQVSLSDDFRPILRNAQQAVLGDARFRKMGKDIDYWRTPTEVFSRSAELWLHWSGVRTSLNGDEQKFDGNPAYETLYPMREQIMEFFGKTFGDPTSRPAAA